MAKDYTLEKRKLVIGGVAIVIVIIYIMRLFVLQIMTDTYKKNADSNAFLNKIQYPSRGAIYDRNGNHRCQVTSASRKNIQAFPFFVKLFFLRLL